MSMPRSPLTSSPLEPPDEPGEPAPPPPPAAPSSPALTRTHKILIGAAAVGVVGAVALPLAIPAAVAALGFGSGGIVAGSWAAGFMASYGGAVSAGSACAVLQSIGAAGLAGTGIATAAAGGAAAGAAAGSAIAAVATSGEGEAAKKGNGDPENAKNGSDPSNKPDSPPPISSLALVPRAATVYDVSARHLFDACDRPLAQYQGKVLLIVNVASRSRFSSGQLASLQRLYQRFAPAGLLVLGFPCDQWGDEPGSDHEMAESYLRTHGVTFPLFTKTLVNGAHTHPLFAYLKPAAKGPLGIELILWNFTKFLVDRSGRVVQRFGPTQTAEDMEARIEELCRSP